MIELDFTAGEIAVAPRAAVPLLLLPLRIDASPPAVPVENVRLQAQVRIEATHRDYSPGEREHLAPLFGSAADWERSLRGLLWTHANLSVPRFAEACTVDLPLPCSYDFNIAATRYFHGLEHGEVPVSLLFSGSIFFRNEDGDLQIAQIAHHKEASCRMPVRVWQAMMDRYYPDGVWLRLGRELFEALCDYQRRHGCATADEALRLLLAAEAEARP